MDKDNAKWILGRFESALLDMAPTDIFSKDELTKDIEANFSGMEMAKLFPLDTFYREEDLRAWALENGFVEKGEFDDKESEVEDLRMEVKGLENEIDELKARLREYD